MGRRNPKQPQSPGLAAGSPRLIFVDVMPSLFLVAAASARLAWAQSRRRGLVNALTGLPNLAALAADRSGRDLPLVAVRVHNYAEIASTLDAAGERQFIEQIVARLTLGQQGRKIYQGDEGIFAWFAPKGTPEAVIKSIRESAKAAVATDKFKDAIKNLGDNVRYMDQPDFAKFWDEDARRVESAVKSIGKVEG